MPKKLTVRDVARNMKICVYGPQGAGKTTFAAMAQDHPDMKDVLFLDCEGGLMSVVSRGDIHYERIHSTRQLEEIFWKVANGDPEYQRFKTFVIDSVTELQAVNLEEVVSEAVEKEKRRRRQQETDRSIDEPHLRDYGKSTTQLRRILRWYKNLPVNVILTALPKYIYPPKKEGQQEGDQQPIEVRPDVTDKLGNALMGLVDAVWYLYTEDVRDENGNVVGKSRFMLTQDYGPFRAKTRGQQFAQALGLVVKDPYLPDLYELLLRTEGGENAAAAQDE